MNSFNLFNSPPLNKMDRRVMMGYIESILEIIEVPLTFHFAWQCGIC